MKKFLLLICLLPGLAFAQHVSDKATRLHRFFKLSAPVATKAFVSVPAALDSVYLYQDTEEILTDKVYFTYNETGQKLTELRALFSFSEGTFVTNSKSEYTYKDIAGGKSVQELTYKQEKGEWILLGKLVTEYNHTQTPVGMYEYYYADGNWIGYNSQVSTEFNAEGYPTVIMDSTFLKDGSCDVVRMEASYDKKHNAEGLSIFEPGTVGDEWIPAQKATLTYDEAGRQLSQYHEVMEEGKWVFSFLFTYEYDERGNMIREIDQYEEGEPYPMRYQNFYSDQIVTKNEVIGASNSIRVVLNNDSKSLSYDLGDKEHAVITIINAGGAIVQRTSVQQSGTLSVSNLNGYYIIHIQTSGGVKSQSVLIR